MRLYFIKDYQQPRDLGEFETDEDAIQEIRRFCDERNFEIHYIRVNDYGSKKWFDVGSHTEFFELCPEFEE